MDGIHFCRSDLRTELKKFTLSFIRFFYYLSVMFLFIFINSGCLGLKIELPSVPELTTDYISIVKKSGNEIDLSKTPRIENVYTNDNNIFSVIKVNNVEKTIQLQWFWYGPTGKLRKKSDVFTVNSKGVYLEYFVAWDVLENRYFGKSAGIWRVVVKNGDKLIAEKRFRISKFAK